MIPKTINGLIVTNIGDALNYSTGENEKSFANKNLTSVVIPNSVTTIGLGAFYSNQMTSIEIPDSVTYLSCYAFDETVSITKNDSLVCVDDRPGK